MDTNQVLGISGVKFRIIGADFCLCPTFGAAEMGGLSCDEAFKIFN